MIRLNLSTRDVYRLLGMHIRLFVRQSQNRKAAFTRAYMYVVHLQQLVRLHSSHQAKTHLHSEP